MCIRSGLFATLLRHKPFHDFLPCTLRVTQGQQIGVMSHRAAWGWSHVHIDSGLVALYLLQWPFAVAPLKLCKAHLVNL